MIAVDLYSKDQFWHKNWCVRVSFSFIIKSMPFCRAKLKLYLKSTPTGQHFGYQVIPINVVFNDVYGLPCLAQSLHFCGRSAYCLYFVYFFISLFRSVSMPMGLCKLLGGGCYAIAYYYSYLDLSIKYLNLSFNCCHL